MCSRHENTFHFQKSNLRHKIIRLDRFIQAITGLRKLEVDECFSMPCLNSGSCLPFESGYYKKIIEICQIFLI